MKKHRRRPVTKVLTHDDLVRRAASWLTTSQKCVLTLSEFQCWASKEQPDVIGWHSDGHSVLVECKMSRADFHKDKRKPFVKRAAKLGLETMGRTRWYMAPEGVLIPYDMPPGYGLAVVKGRVVRVLKRPVYHERPGRGLAEIPILINAARRQAWERGHLGRKVRLESVPDDSCEEGGDLC